LNPYFSKSSIRRFEGRIQNTAGKLLNRLVKAGKIGEILPIKLAFKAATCDVISEYCFGVSTGYVEYNDYNRRWFDAVDALFYMAWPMTYISWLGPLIDKLPPAVIGLMHPGLKSLWNMHTVSSNISSPVSLLNPCSSNGSNKSNLLGRVGSLNLQTMPPYFMVS
jgi:hypothetical protein